MPILIKFVIFGPNASVDIKLFTSQSIQIIGFKQPTRVTLKCFYFKNNIEHSKISNKIRRVNSVLRTKVKITSEV